MGTFFRVRSCQSLHRAHHYAEQHNTEISRYNVPEARAEREIFGNTMVEAMLRENEAVRLDLWRDTPAPLKDVRTLPPAQEWDRLALFAAQAFGDGRYPNQKPVTTHGAVFTLTDITPPQHQPTRPTLSCLQRTSRHLQPA